MTPHAAAILDMLRTRRADGKPFTHGIPTSRKLTGYGFSDTDRAMQTAFTELLAAGLVVEAEVTAQTSRYELVQRQEEEA